jgi:hypothetical protein
LDEVQKEASRAKEKLPQTREADGDVEARIVRLVGLWKVARWRPAIRH